MTNDARRMDTKLQHPRVDAEPGGAPVSSPIYQSSTDVLPTPELGAELEGAESVVATRTFQAPARLLFEAWTKAELIMRWWAPASFGITFLSCETDAHTGGGYRYVFSHPDLEQPMAFFGRYIEVTPPTRIVWSNEEEAEGSVTTVTFEETDGQTLVVVRDLYPSREALDAAIASGGTGAWPEQFDELANLLSAPGAG